MTLTIGILDADRVRPELAEIYGDYPTMFTQLLSEADPTIKTVRYDVMNGEYPTDIDEVDCYLLTGSKFSVYEDEDWIRELGSFVSKLNARKKKLVAICFGHQLVSHFLGGRVAKSEKGWGVGVRTCTVDKDIPGLAKAGESLSFLATHQDQVQELAVGAEVYASSDFCPNMITGIGDHILTIQWHPEFVKGYAEALLHIRRDVIGEETYQIALASLDQDIDNSRFAECALAFFRA